MEAGKFRKWRRKFHSRLQKSTLKDNEIGDTGQVQDRTVAETVFLFSHILSLLTFQQPLPFSLHTFSTHELSQVKDDPVSSITTLYLNFSSFSI